MATHLGAHSERLSTVRALQSAKGRRDHRRFAFESATLLEEAGRSGTPVEELYVTQAAFDATPLVRELDAGGTPTFIVDERSAAKISDVETPTGILAVAPIAFANVDEILAGDGLVLLLADLNDPGNAGTLLRSADAFGCRGVVFGRSGVDPHHPKVVRGAMGAVFRLPLAVADPDDLAAAAGRAGYEIVALAGDGEPLATLAWPARTCLLVGHERRGLGRWESLGVRRAGIPMHGTAESLNAAVAGSIALYEAAKRPANEPARPSCQESV